MKKSILIFVIVSIGLSGCAPMHYTRDDFESAEVEREKTLEAARLERRRALDGRGLDRLPHL